MSAILHLADGFFRKEKMPVLILKSKLLFDIFNGDISECLKLFKERIVLISYRGFFEISPFNTAPVLLSLHKRY